MTNIVATPELYGTIISKFESTKKEFEANPTDFAKKFGFDSIKLNAVKNEEDTINLALPYYSGLQRSAGSAMSDEQLDVASGGQGAAIADHNSDVVKAWGVVVEQSHKQAWEKTASAVEGAMEIVDSLEKPQGK